MSRSESESPVWGDFENETLIYTHKRTKIYKKRYQRASYFHNSLYRFFGLITVVASTVASTMSWGSGGEITPEQHIILSSITTISAISAAIQNFYKFQENANSYFTTAKSYTELQNKIESTGNIHPDYRISKPNIFIKKTQNTLDQISDNRLEISNYMTKHFYSKKNDGESYLEDKHRRYKLLKEEEKLNYTKDKVNAVVETDESDGDD